MEGANTPSGNPFNATQFNLEIAGYLRTEDIIYLNCESKDEQYVISSDGFGSSEIFLGAYQDKFTLWKSAFIIEQATSVHMLNTQLHNGASKKSKSGQSGNTKIHKTLTYGNAIILRHVTSKKYLTCQPRIGNQSDYKLRFVRTISDGCWFIVLPGNTASCIGDKVKSGDGALLKNHLTERYIYNNKTEIKKTSEQRTSDSTPPYTVERSKSSPSGQKGQMRHKLSKSLTISEQFEDTEYIGSKELKKIELKIDFKKTIWRIMVLASSDARDLYQDYLSGEDYIQIYSPIKGYLGPEVAGDTYTEKITHIPPLHRKSLSCLDEFLSRDVRKEDQSRLMYKQDTSGVGNVWRVETIKSVGGKWGASFVSWQQAFNLVNVVTGTYLAYSKERRELCLLKLDEIREESHNFETIDFMCMSSECKEKIEKGGAKVTTNVADTLALSRGKEGLFFDEEEFPPPQIKFAESSILLLADTEQMPCVAFDTFVTEQKESKIATTSQDHKCIFSLNFSLVSSEKAYAANLICVTDAIVDAFKSLRVETLKNEFKNFYPARKNLRNMLSDLKSYLEPQGNNTWDEVDSRDPTMKKLSLRAKQTLFSSEGILLEFPAILAYLQELRCQIRIDVKRDHLRMINELTRDILEVIALMIDGNPENCQKLVRKDWLDIFFDLLDIQAFFEGVLKVLHLAVKGSPTVLTLFSENSEYFDRIFNLLRKFGRNEKVLDLLSALCVHEGVAIRRNQDNITKLLLCSDIRNSLFLKTYSVSIVDFFRPNICLHYVPGSASYAEWFFEVEFKSTSDNNDDTLHTRVGWAYAEYFKTEPTVIAYESQTQFEAEPVKVGVGSDLTSFGFDGQFIWIGGNKYPVERSMDERIHIFHEPITVGCYLDIQKGRAWFFLNGKQINISITGIVPEEYMTPVVSLRGQVEAVVRFGKEYGKFKYPPPQNLFKPAPLCDARLSIHDSLKMEKWVCPDQMDNRQIDIATPEDPLPQGVVTLSSPISLEKFNAFIPIQAQDLEPMTPSTSIADTRRKSLPDFAMAFQLGSKKQDLAEFLHDAWSEKCISLEYKWGKVTDPLKKTMRELDHFDKLDEHDQEEYIALAEVLIDGLNKYDCNFDLLNWKYDRPRRRSEVYQPMQYNLSKPHWNRYHDAISRQLTEYVHNQLCMKRIQRGWRYGYELDEQLKLHPSLRPLESFEQTTLTYLRLRHLINSTIQLVLASSGGNLELKQEEETKVGMSEEIKSETRFTTFKVSNQFAVSYSEKGNNRWYFEAIIKSEGQIRVGWATTDATPGVPLGDDKHSYAFSGYLVACKCHNNTESFGKTWKKDSILGCFLDLNDGTIIFSLDGLFLRSSNNVKYAFNNIPVDKHYLPAVSLGPEQRAILNFGQKEDSLQMLQRTFEQSEVFRPFGEGIISNIPIYISLKANDSVKIEKSGSQPVRILNPPKQWKTPPPIKIQLKKKTRMLCISLNMGICPINAKEERFSFSVSIPNLDKRQTYERGFIGFTTSHFTQMNSQYQPQTIGEIASPGPIYSLDKECLGAGIVGEENTPGELISFYLIPLTTLIDQFTNEKPQAVNTNFLRVTCVMDLTTSMIQFYLDEDCISEIPLLNSNFSLYPTLLYAGNIGEIIEFDFNKFRDCSPFIHGLLDPAICGDNVFTERMHLRISTPHKWSNLELNSNRFSIHLKRDEGISINSKLMPSKASLLDSETYEDNAFASLGEDMPRRFSRVYSIEAEVTHLEEDTFEFFPYQIPKFEKHLYHPNKNMYLLVPEESSLISLMDAVENNQLIEFYTKTILLLISVCDKDFIKAKEMVLEYVGFQHLLSSLELGIQQLIPVQLSLAIYKLCIALFLEAEFNLKAMTRKESLIEMMTGPSQIITVLPRDPTVNDYYEEDSSASSVSRWHFYYGSQLLTQLKGMVFAKLWEIMTYKVYTCTFLKEKNMREGVLMPLLNVIKHLVLTEKLDPVEYTWLMLIIEPKYKGYISDETRYNKLPFEEGLLSILDLEDSIKYEICCILDYLYDLHVRRQVYKTVHFMMNISNELKQKQEEKMEFFKNQPHHPSGRELRQPPNQQIEYFLEQVTLRGVDKFYEQPIDKLKNYYFYFKSTFECLAKVSEENEIKPTNQNLNSDFTISAVRTTKLRDLVIEGLLKWARQIADNHPLREITFSLVRRYMSRVEEFREVLARTYVLPKGSQRSETLEASRAAEILGALGYLRSVLNIKLNQEDETRLTLAISTLTNANVLFQYPDSLFILGVYEAVLNVMEHILRECLPKQVQNKLKKRISVKFGTLRKMHSFGITQNTFACCIHFLCSLIRYFPLFSIHSSNSTDVFFSEIDKLIELSFIYVHSTKKDTLSSPLEVVNSLIKQNEKLTLSLKENQINQILEFLTNTLFKVPENKLRKFEVEYEYRHGLCYLDFLKYAVSSQEKYIETNAKIVVMYFINHKETIDLTLLKFFNKQTTTSEPELLFYTNFLDLLGKCAPPRKYSCDEGEDSVGSENDSDNLQFRKKTCLLLQNFISKKQILNFLSLKGHQSEEKWMLYKSALIVILERIHGITDPPSASESKADTEGAVQKEYLNSESDTKQEINFLTLVDGPFLCDLSAALLKHQIQVNDSLRGQHNRVSYKEEHISSLQDLNYIMNAVLPVMTKGFHNMQRLLLTETDTHILNSTLYATYWISFLIPDKLPGRYKKPLSEFFSEFATVIPPSIMCNFFRCISQDISHMRIGTAQVVFKFFQLHLEHYESYYNQTNSELQGRAKSTEQEDLVTLFFQLLYYLLKINGKVTSKDQTEDHPIIPALIALSGCISPMTLTKTQIDDLLSDINNVEAAPTASLDLDVPFVVPQDSLFPYSYYNRNQKRSQDRRRGYSLRRGAIGYNQLDEKLQSYGEKFWAQVKEEIILLNEGLEQLEDPNKAAKLMSELVDCLDQENLAVSTLKPRDRDSSASIFSFQSSDGESSLPSTRPEIVRRDTGYGHKTLQRMTSQTNSFQNQYKDEFTERLSRHLYFWVCGPHSVLASPVTSSLPTSSHDAEHMPFELLLSKKRRALKEIINYFFQLLDYLGLRVRRGPNQEREGSNFLFGIEDAGESRLLQRFSLRLLRGTKLFLERTTGDDPAYRVPSSLQDVDEGGGAFVAQSKKAKATYSAENLKFFLRVLVPVLNRHFYLHNVYYLKSGRVFYQVTATAQESDELSNLFTEFVTHLPKIHFILEASNRSIITLKLRVFLKSISDAIEVTPKMAEEMGGDGTYNLSLYMRSGSHILELVSKRTGEYSSWANIFCTLTIMLPFFINLFRKIVTSLEEDVVEYFDNLEGSVRDKIKPYLKILFNSLMKIGIQPEIQEKLVMKEQVGTCIGLLTQVAPLAIFKEKMDSYGVNPNNWLDMMSRSELIGKNLFLNYINLPILTYTLAKSGKDPEVDPIKFHKWVDQFVEEAFNHLIEMVRINQDFVLLWTESHMEKVISWCSPDVFWRKFLEVITEVRLHLLQVYNADKAEQHEIQTQSQSKMGYTNIDNKYFQTMYKMVAQQYIATISLLWRYLNKDNIREEVERKDVNDKFVSLLIILMEIFDIWCESQSFKKECLSLVKCIKDLIVFEDSMLLGVIFTDMEVNTNYPLERRSAIVLILRRILHFGKAIPFIENNEDLINEGVKLLQEGKSQHGVSDLIIEKFSSSEKTNPKQGPINKLTSIANKVLSQNDGDHIQLFMKEFILMKHRLTVMANHTSPGASKWKWLRHKQIIRNMIKFLASKQLCKMANFRVTNYLIQGYRQRVLSVLESKQNLIRNLVQSNVSKGSNASGASLERVDFQPIAPLVSLLEVPAKTVHDEQLYLEYTRYLFQACDSLWNELDENDDTMDDERDPTEVEDRKYRRIALEKLQEKLNELDVPQMVVKVLINCGGVWSASVYHCLQLGIAILRGGNEAVQESMLTFITKTCPKETPLFRNISKLITSSTVLDLELFNRGKAIMTHGHRTSKINALGHYEYTIALFRFLQLLCEGHNASFQEYLHTQVGKSTTVNLVQITVDYLLLMQESISSFCWHYNNMDHIEIMGQDNISCAFSVIKQVLITLTEYIQGPCKLNQTALSRSRLWDAIQGLLRLFAYLQEQLSNTNSIELLREVLKVLSDMIVLLLSMLEGNQMSSEIGVSMKHTLVDCRNELQDITKFCFMFIKLNDTLTSKAFTQYDTNKDGRISRLEFERSLQTQKQYSQDEVDYLMRCGDTNRDGYIDYAEFLDRFLLRAEEIGFNLVVLLQNLFEHLPKTNSDFELNDLRNRGKELMEFFNNHLGSIEIIGKSRTVEKVYFQIPKSCRDQWARSQIQESKREFINTCDHENVNSKLDKFIDFSENTIFEMRHFGKLCQVEEWERESRAKSHRDQNRDRFRDIQPGPQSQEYTTRDTVRGSTFSATFKAKCLGIFLLVVHILKWCGRNTRRFIPKRFRRKKQPEDSATTCWLTEDNTCRLPGEEVLETGECVELEPSHLMKEAEQYYEKSKIIPIGFSDEYNDLKNKKYSRWRKVKQYTRELTQLTHYWPLIIQSNFRFSSFLVENEQTLKSLRFFSVIFMNFMLLFYYQSDQDSFAYDYKLTLILTASLHITLSLLLLYTYIMWKVPLECFKREKKICIEILQNSDILKAFLDSKSKPFLSQYWWDAWALKSDKFPRMYWDKYFKQKVRDNYADMDREAEINELLGENRDTDGDDNEELGEDNYRSLNEYTHGKFGVDYYYAVWMLFRVYLSDRNLLFSLMYICFTCMGLLFDSFFFAFHLIPEMMAYFSTLRTVVVSVTIHGKRLVYTTLLMSAVIFIYTVFAFRFFTTYYNKNCTNMITCLQFHLSAALRSGGGVSDVIDTPDKMDPLVLPRFVFDMSFFFIVIVFLLAIIQGLIIDAFGELRDREEGVRASMQNKCFICGINKDKFNQVPRGYEKHTTKEHYYPNYLFFLMYLINKHDTLYTGQESYVWDLYLQRKWDFFPIGCYFEQNNNDLPGAENSP